MGDSPDAGVIALIFPSPLTPFFIVLLLLCKSLLVKFALKEPIRPIVGVLAVVACLEAFVPLVSLLVGGAVSMALEIEGPVPVLFIMVALSFLANYFLVAPLITTNSSRFKNSMWSGMVMPVTFVISWFGLGLLLEAIH